MISEASVLRKKAGVCKSYCKTTDIEILYHDIHYSVSSNTGWKFVLSLTQVLRLPKKKVWAYIIMSNMSMITSVALSGIRQWILKA